MESWRLTTEDLRNLGLVVLEVEGREEAERAEVEGDDRRHALLPNTAAARHVSERAQNHEQHVSERRMASAFGAV